jgi:serine/threonine protein kinase
MSPSRYPIDREIGRGEMGVVFLAHDPRLDRPLAVKVLTLPPSLSADQSDEYRRRFLREAKAAAALTHPGIVTVYDAGDEDGQLFIAMEYVRGETLRERLQRVGKIEPAVAVSIASCVADALHAAHEKGIVHRDIKPANILLGAEDGAVKIADFGVACLPGAELTKQRISIGSPAYMAPEQIEGASLPASDLFALAVVLYECLCGRRPFQGETLPALSWAIKTQEPAPLDRNLPGCPPGLEAFFAKALAKDPALRFRSGAEFRAALQDAYAAPAPSSAEARSRRKTPQELVLVGVSTILIAAVVLAVVQDRLVATAPARAASRDGGDASATGSPATGSPAAAPAPRSRRPVPTGSLTLRIKNNVPDGTMTLMVDGRTVYTHRLAAPPRSGLARKSERIEAQVRIPAGRHVITAQVRQTGKEELEKSIDLEMKAGQSRELQLVLGRPLGPPLSLKAD